ncbi:MAG TPA: SDR family NAD(P)-dependent oxidoreductase [Acidimicrobiia bacterium]|nr:SDR family NAD(P)-dependent oxidoreductase [Acidimicrobiia bacterium]
MSFAGSTAIVTGGASGIGLAISERLARDGAKVAVFDLDGEQAEQAAKGIRDVGGEAIACTVDVSDRAQVDEAVARTRRELGPVLVLVNCAGKDAFDRFMDITTEQWERILAVNLTGTFHCTQAVLPDMLEAEWGRIVNVSSSSGQTGAERMAHYASSKAGMIGLTKSLALELGRDGITVNTIPPGSIDTPMSRRSAEEGRFRGGTLDDVARTLPVRRIGRPEDIAAACAYLVSDEAGYVTGQIIGVNGGRVT